MKMTTEERKARIAGMREALEQALTDYYMEAEVGNAAAWAEMMNAAVEKFESGMHALRISWDTIDEMKARADMKARNFAARA